MTDTNKENTPQVVEDEEELRREAEEEQALAKVPQRAMRIDDLMSRAPKSAIEAIENRINALNAIRIAAIRATSPTDWVLMKARDSDDVNGMLKKSGALIVRKYYGISVTNLRPVNNRTGAAEVEVYTETRGSGREVTVGQIFGDASCALTQEVVCDLRGVRSLGESFIGRDDNLEDFKEAVRSNLETKAVRILAGMSSVSREELEGAWAGTTKSIERAGKGAGFGTAAERRTRRAAGSAPTPAAAQPAGAPEAKIERKDLNYLLALSYDIQKYTPGMSNQARGQALRTECEALGFDKPDHCPPGLVEKLAERLQARINEAKKAATSDQ